MQKLIFINQTKAHAIATNGVLDGWTSSSNAYYQSLVFTSDGHLLTHGIDFSITPSSSLIGGAAGNIVYQSSAGATSFISTPGSNGNYVIQYTNNVPSLVLETTYKLKLNDVTKGDTNGTSLGSFYAPETHGDANGKVLISQGLESNKAPIWKDLSQNFTGVSNTEDLSIPTRKAVKDYVDTAIANSVSSVFSPKGPFDGFDDSNKHPKDGNSTYTVLAIGDAYTYSGTSDLTLPAANSISGSAETIQNGDTIICVEKNTPKYTVLQGNWTATAGSSILSWNTEVTLATIGGVDVKAKLPVNPNTTHNFYVGETGANATAANVATGTDIYLTTKLTSDEANANGTNILGFHAGTGISISSVSGLLTFANTGVTKFNNQTGDLTSSYNSSNNKLTIAGTEYTLNNTDTWRNVYVGGTQRVGTATNTKGINFVGTGSTTVTYKAAGAGGDQSGSSDYFNVEISSSNTWREVDVYKITSNTETDDTLSLTNTGTASLKFSNTFSTNSSDEIDLMWMEISSSGKITYVV